MGNKAAREAATAAQTEVMRSTNANVEDFAAFFDARKRAEAVDGSMPRRRHAFAQEAAARRDGHRLQCGAALRAMRERVGEIARMAGISEKPVRELLLRETQSAESAAHGRAMWSWRRPRRQDRSSRNLIGPCMFPANRGDPDFSTRPILRFGLPWRHES